VVSTRNQGLTVVASRVLARVTVPATKNRMRLVGHPVGGSPILQLNWLISG
jgi:hypothetical protein